MKKLWNLLGAIALGTALVAPWGALDARSKDADEDGWGEWYRAYVVIDGDTTDTFVYCKCTDGHECYPCEGELIGIASQIPGAVVIEHKIY